MKFKYYGLSEVISGGQTGVDQAALVAAFQSGISTAGHAPKGWKTDRGANPLLQCFGLLEDGDSDYRPRTIKNIKQADGTLIIYYDRETPGTRLTINQTLANGKPLFEFFLPLEAKGAAFDAAIEAKIHDAVCWIKEQEIGTLNVAGHRDERHNIALFELSVAILKEIFSRLDKDNLVVKVAD
jgi:hypothetical protein